MSRQEGTADRAGRTTLDIGAIQAHLREFVAEREWERFHTPKNLAMALAAEAGELLELFQWLSEDESKRIAGSEEDMALLRDELADVLVYVLRLADVAGVDLAQAVDLKLAKNAEKYPADLARGNATKYTRRAARQARELER